MNKAKVVNAGVDTLVLNAFYTDERGRPCKRELDPSLWRQLEEWKRAAQEAHEECPTTLVFEDVVLHWLVGKGDEYLERVGRDFSTEVQRKRVKFGLQIQ
jgi:hypothetical protein